MIFNCIARGQDSRLVCVCVCVAIFRPDLSAMRSILAKDPRLRKLVSNTWKYLCHVSFSCLSLGFSSAAAASSSCVSSSCSASLAAKAANALAFLIVGRSIYFIMSINIMRH